MMLPGRYDAKMDGRGRIVLPEYFRKHWNSGRVFAATELSESGMYVACYPHQPDQEEYREHRRARLERLLTAESVPPAVARRTALIDITKDAHFAMLAIDRHNSVLLRDLCRDAMIENPLLWISTGMPAFNGNYCLELWNTADFERAEAQMRQEIGDAIRRVYHVSPQR